MGMIKEFKEFAVKGNMIDMAVGIIIGGAFGKIVSSLVSDVIMPPIGIVTSGVDFKDYVIDLGKEGPDGEPLTLKIGSFIDTLVQFFIVAFAVFMLVKAINSMKREAEEKPKESPKPSQQEVLLAEIRDLLKTQN